MRRLSEFLVVLVAACTIGLVVSDAIAAGHGACPTTVVTTLGGTSSLSCTVAVCAQNSQCAMWSGTNQFPIDEVVFDPTTGSYQTIPHAAAGSVTYKTCRCKNTQTGQFYMFSVDTCCDLAKITQGGAGGVSVGVTGECGQLEANCPPGDICSAHAVQKLNEWGFTYYEWFADCIVS